ncbi:MAG: hypothetical protein AB8G11_21985 [Saprospiraceae bacterium]
MKKSLLITVTFLLFNTIAFTQPGKLNRANRHFEKGNYDKAIVLYEKAFEKEKREDRAKNNASKINGIHAAIKTENYDNAELWLGQVIHIQGTPVECRLYYATCLGLNGKCDLGKYALMKYQEKVGSDERIVPVEDFLKQACWKKESKFDWSKIIVNQ